MKPSPSTMYSKRTPAPKSCWSCSQDVVSAHVGMESKNGLYRARYIRLASQDQGRGPLLWFLPSSGGLFLSFLDYKVKSSGQRPSQFSRTSEISRQNPTQTQASFTTGLGFFLAHLSLPLHFYDRQAHIMSSTSCFWKILWYGSNLPILAYFLFLYPSDPLLGDV